MTEKTDVSVLMPTYNDSKYIRGAIESLLNQKYEKWELIIIDGSTDNTPEIVKQFDDDRIIYLREKSTGQLNALFYGSSFIHGQYITLLHSDDELSDNDVLERNMSALRNNDYDGVFSDILKMDGNGKIYGIAKAVNHLDSYSPALLFLRAGSNIVPDFFFIKKSTFKNVFSNYMTWNMPYWLRFEENRIRILTLKKVRPWYRYRVYSENYIQSDVGKFETINGCLRTIIEIGQRLDLLLLKIQKLLTRAFKTWPKPLFRSKPCSSRHLQEMVQYVFNRYFGKIPENIYYNALQGFYANFPSNRTISLQFEEEEKIFFGKDARIFFNLMEKKRLPPIYEYVLEEAINGFGKVVVMNDENCEKAKTMMKFLNLLTRITTE